MSEWKICFSEPNPSPSPHDSHRLQVRGAEPLNKTHVSPLETSALPPPGLLSSSLVPGPALGRWPAHLCCRPSTALSLWLLPGRGHVGVALGSSHSTACSSAVTRAPSTRSDRRSQSVHHLFPSPTLVGFTSYSLLWPQPWLRSEASSDPEECRETPPPRSSDRTPSSGQPSWASTSSSLLVVSAAAKLPRLPEASRGTHLACRTCAVHFVRPLSATKQNSSP